MNKNSKMWHDSWGEKPWQYDDKYLVALTNELNSSCEKQKELKQAKESNTNLKKIKNLESSNIREWEPDDLDYDFTNCTNNCYNDTYWNEEKLICNSCAKLLDEKIRIPFNKTPREIGQEFQELNDRIEKLEKLVQTILENSNKEENL